MTEETVETAPAAAESAASARSQRKVRVGRVISDKMDKTVVVQISTLKQHSRYKKTIQHRIKFKVHDERNECGMGDMVRIMESRPISKEKRWRVVEILEKAK